MPLRHCLLPGLLAVAAALLSATNACASGRWQALDDYLQQHTAANGFPGAVALIEKDGQRLFQRHYGHQDIARTQPMREDSLFRIYSMTKPVVSVAVLQLMEQGRLQLDDPLSRLLPEFAGTRVLFEPSTGGVYSLPSPQPLTLRHLLTHTSGLSAASDQHPAAARALIDAGVEASLSLAEVSARLATVPLSDPPGTHFHYEGSNTLLLGRVVEVVSGQPLADYLQQHIFNPLGMADTGFEVPQEQRYRVVDLATGDAGALVLANTHSARHPGDRLNPYDNAAGGLYSSAADYLRFARALLDDGSGPGPALLRPETLALMMGDQLGSAFGAPIAGFSAGEGFGLGGYVITDPVARGRLGSVGQFGWSGAASTWFMVDREQQLVAILLMQYVGDGQPQRLPSPSTGFYNHVYQALDESGAIATEPVRKAGNVARDGDQSVFPRR